MQARSGSTDAIREYREAVRRNPRSLAARRRLAEAFELRGEVERAFREWRRVAALDRTDAYPFSRLAEVFQIRRDFASAAACWREASRLDPESAEYRHGLAVALRKFEAREAASAQELSAA